MKIKITRQTHHNGILYAPGAMPELADDEAESLVELGLAERVQTPPAAKKEDAAKTAVKTAAPDAAKVAAGTGSAPAGEAASA